MDIRIGGIRLKKISLIVVILLLLVQGCASTKPSTSNKIRIAEQYGIAYAPIQIMKDKKLVEKYLPDVEVVWEQMSNTTAIREAMIAHRLDVGFMAIPPFLIGWDKGMDWKIFTGLSSVPVGLVTSKDIKTIKDIASEHRIALPQPGSVQHILLSMASEKTFNNPQKFDNILVTMSHPDGMNALLSGGEIHGHFTSTPYLEQEVQEDGLHQILSGKEAFGQDFSFIVGVTTKKLRDENSEIYDGLSKAVAEGIAFINDNPEEAARILTSYYDLEEDKIIEYISSQDTEYSTTVKGTKRFGEFMKVTGYLSKTYDSYQQIMWDNVVYED